MRYKLLIIAFACLFLLSSPLSVAQVEKFDVELDIDDTHMTYKILYVTIRNLQDSPDDISLSTILYDTDFSIYDVTNVEFAIEKEETFQVEIQDYDYIFYEYENGDSEWKYEVVGSHLEDRERMVWKSKPLISKTEDGLKGELKHQWEEITITKAGTPKDTLIFRFKFNHPIIETTEGWGSKGRIKLDINDEIFGLSSTEEPQSETNPLILLSIFPLILLVSWIRTKTKKQKLAFLMVGLLLIPTLGLLLTTTQVKPVLAYLGRDYLWISDGDDSIYQVRASDPETIVDSYDFGTASPFGCEENNDYIWFVDYGSDILYKKLWSDKSEDNSWDISGYAGTAYGLAIGGGYIWVANRGDDLIYKVDPADPTTSVGSFDYGTIGYVSGLGWNSDNDRLLVSDDGNDEFYSFDVSTVPDNGDSVTLVPDWTKTNGGSAPTGIVWDGTYFWSIDDGSNLLYKQYDNMDVIATYDPPGGGPQGLAFTTYVPGNWWDSDWTYRKQIMVSPHPENYQINIFLDYADNLASHSQDDFEDVRFLEQRDSGELDQWRENWNLSENVDFWFRRIDNEVSDDNIWMYYGNAGVSTSENGGDTFVLFDHFGGDTVDDTKWTTGGGTPAVSGGTLVLDGGGSKEGVGSVAQFGIGYAFRSRWYVTSAIEYQFAFASAWEPTDSAYMVNIFHWTETDFNFSTKNGGSRIDNAQSWLSVFSYHTYEIQRRDNIYASALQDDIVEANSSSQITTQNLYLYFLSGVNQSYYVDWTLIRKYAYPEPTVTLGEEETETPNVVPNPPTNLLPSTRQTTVNVTLSADVTDNDDDNMNVYFYDNSDDSAIDNIWADNGTTAQVTWSALTIGNTYVFFVGAMDNENNWSENSATQSFTVNTLPTAPTNPLDLGMNLTDHSPTITWTEGTDNDGDTITTFIYLGTTSTPTEVDASTTDETDDLGENASHSTYPLENRGIYYYRLRTWDGYEFSTAYTTADNFRMTGFPSGDGTLGDPYIIDNVDLLQDMNYGLTDNYALGDNIDATETIDWNGGDGFVRIGWNGDDWENRFQGSFDGQGYVIKNLHGSSFFGFTHTGSSVTNVGMENVNMTTGGNYSAALIGFMKDGGYVDNCWATGTLTGSSYSAGLVGEIEAGTITNSYVNMTINVGVSQAGGITSYATSGATIENCYSSGTINGTGNVGGIAGDVRNGSRVLNSYSTATVPSGLVARLVGVTSYIINSYSMGVGGGGLIGISNSGTVINSFWDNEASGASTSMGGVGKTTENMKNIRTFTDTAWNDNLDNSWDFVGNPYADVWNNNIWNMDKDNTINNGYPFLVAIEGETEPMYNIPPIVENLKTERFVNPENVENETPTFSWDYSDNDDDNQSNYQIQIGTTIADNDMWDYIGTGDNASIVYDGTALDTATYYVRVRAHDSYDWSDWDNGYFITLLKQLEVITKSLTGNQDNATVIIEIGYDDNSTLDNINAELWLNDVYADNENVDLSDNLITFTNVNLPDNTSSITIKLENVKTNTKTWITENLLFTENTTASFTIDDTTLSVYLDESETFTGTIASNATYISLNITAYLKYGGITYDSENYTDNENWSLTTTPTSSKVYDVEMYENDTLMWTTSAKIYVSFVGPGGGYVYIPQALLYVNFEVLENTEPIVNALVEGTQQLTQYKVGERYEVLVSGYTDFEGKLKLEITEGTWSFIISKEGYQTYVIEDKEVYTTTGFDIILTIFKPEKIDSDTAIFAITIGGLTIGIVSLSGYLLFTKRIGKPRKTKEKAEEEWGLTKKKRHRDFEEDIVELIKKRKKEG